MIYVKLKDNPLQLSLCKRYNHLVTPAQINQTKTKTQIKKGFNQRVFLTFSTKSDRKRKISFPSLRTDSSLKETVSLSKCELNILVKFQLWTLTNHPHPFALAQVSFNSIKFNFHFFFLSNLFDCDNAFIYMKVCASRRMWQSVTGVTNDKPHYFYMFFVSNFLLVSIFF